MNYSQKFVFIIGLLAVPYAFANTYQIMQDNVNNCSQSDWTKGAPFNGCKYYLYTDPDTSDNCPSPADVPTISLTCGVPVGNCYIGVQNKLNLSAPGDHVTLRSNRGNVNKNCSIAIFATSFSTAQPFYSHNGHQCSLEIFSVGGWGPFPPPDTAGQLTGPFTCTLKGS